MNQRYIIFVIGITIYIFIKITVETRTKTEVSSHHARKATNSQQTRAQAISQQNSQKG